MPVVVVRCGSEEHGTENPNEARPVFGHTRGARGGPLLTNNTAGEVLFKRFCPHVYQTGARPGLYGRREIPEIVGGSGQWFGRRKTGRKSHTTPDTLFAPTAQPPSAIRVGELSRESWRRNEQMAMDRQMECFVLLRRPVTSTSLPVWRSRYWSPGLCTTHN